MEPWCPNLSVVAVCYIGEPLQWHRTLVKGTPSVNKAQLQLQLPSVNMMKQLVHRLTAMKTSKHRITSPWWRESTGESTSPPLDTQVPLTSKVFHAMTSSYSKAPCANQNVKVNKYIKLISHSKTARLMNILDSSINYRSLCQELEGVTGFEK